MHNDVTGVMQISVARGLHDYAAPSREKERMCTGVNMHISIKFTILLIQLLMLLTQVVPIDSGHTLHAFPVYSRYTKVYY